MEIKCFILIGLAVISGMFIGWLYMRRVCKEIYTHFVKYINAVEDNTHDTARYSEETKIEVIRTALLCQTKLAEYIKHESGLKV